MAVKVPMFPTKKTLRFSSHTNLLEQNSKTKIRIENKYDSDRRAVSRFGPSKRPSPASLSIGVQVSAPR